MHLLSSSSIVQKQQQSYLLRIMLTYLINSISIQLINIFGELVNS